MVQILVIIPMERDTHTRNDAIKYARIKLDFGTKFKIKKFKIKNGHDRARGTRRKMKNDTYRYQREKIVLLLLLLLKLLFDVIICRRRFCPPLRVFFHVLNLILFFLRVEMMMMMMMISDVS
jgi:hypothetical protein